MIVAFLGRADSPTDAVEDYCRLLGGAFEERGVASVRLRVRWDEVGWSRALRELWRAGTAWEGDWALAQYTALMWSRRGFPLLFLVVLSLLKLRKMRLSVVFHDREPYGGRRLVERLRRACQIFVMRCAYRLSDASILCIPLESVSWLPPNPNKASFIPVGPNIPALTSRECARNGNEVWTITVFAITDRGDIDKEVSDITLAARAAAERLPCVRLLTLGRGSIESAVRFRQALKGSPVEYRPLGILPAAEVSRVLSSSDLALFVRGPISTQRGSAIASIACGLPLVAYADSSLPAPLAEAGVVGVRYPDAAALVEATVRVLTDLQLQYELRERSRRAHQAYFSWEAVANRFLEVLHHA